MGEAAGRWLLAGCVAVCLWGCGPRQAEVIRRLEPPAPSGEGPPVSDEEASGEVPPLKPILPPKPLIPSKKAPTPPSSG